jgi:hypothetical protein
MIISDHFEAAVTANEDASLRFDIKFFLSFPFRDDLTE